MMTAARFAELKQTKHFIGPNEQAEFERMLEWEARSQAAFRAVATKRRKYKTWPTRKGDHRT